MYLFNYCYEIEIPSIALLILQLIDSENLSCQLSKIKIEYLDFNSFHSSC